MELKFELEPTKYFLKQVEVLSEKEKSKISKKLSLIKENPTRFKSLSGYKHLFEIKLDINNKYSRLIYAIYFPNKNKITIFGIFDREKNFKDFYKLFKLNLKKIKK